MNRTELTFINHASMCVVYDGQYLLTDPWFEAPAFGSWLPTFPPFVHPAYLVALGSERLSILISHGHDDHCDDRLLSLFDRATRVISSDYSSPSVKNRLRRIGLANYIEASDGGREVGPFTVRSFRNEGISLDDAVYSIRTPDALIVHCNDNWIAMADSILVELQREVATVSPANAIFMSQTNSASGFPLNYRCFTEQEKAELLWKKVREMIRVGTQNCARLGIEHFVSYAGYASVYVKDRPTYLSASLFPSPTFIKEHFAEVIAPGVSILDFLPGDTFDFHAVRRSFLGRSYSDDSIRAAAGRFYAAYGQIKACDTYSLTDDGAPYDPAAVDDFLACFDTFVRSKLDRSGFHPSVLGKTLSIIVTDTGNRSTVRLGSGCVAPQASNKEIYVSWSILWSVIEGHTPFENLYTGYIAEFSRDPVNTYNEDIIRYLVMFSHFYLNSKRAR
jgi:hypothetical protein